MKEFKPKIWERKPWEKVKYPRLGYITRSQFELHLKANEKSHIWAFHMNYGNGGDKIIRIEKCEICGKKKEIWIKKFKF